VTRGNKIEFFNYNILKKEDALLLNSFTEIFAKDFEMTGEEMAFGICSLI